jgi:hypothetical protein
MINIRFMIYAILAMIGIAQPLSAYIFEFSNHTNIPLYIRIHLTGDPGDKYYEGYVAPRTQGESAMHKFKFGPSHGYKWIEAEWHKEWFCLGEIYVRTPITETQTVIGPNGEEIDVEILVKDKDGKVIFGPWKSAAITLVKGAGANAIAEAAGKIGDSLLGIAKDVAGAVVKYKTDTKIDKK